MKGRKNLNIQGQYIYGVKDGEVGTGSSTGGEAGFLEWIAGVNPSVSFLPALLKMLMLFSLLLSSCS